VPPPAHLLAVGVIKHLVHDVLGQLGLVGVSRPAHPGVDDALVVRALKGHLGERRVSADRTGRGGASGQASPRMLSPERYLEDEAKLRVEQSSVRGDLDAPRKEAPEAPSARARAAVCPPSA